MKLLLILFSLLLTTLNKHYRLLSLFHVNVLYGESQAYSPTVHITTTPTSKHTPSYKLLQHLPRYGYYCLHFLFPIFPTFLFSKLTCELFTVWLVILIFIFLFLVTLISYSTRNFTLVL